MSGAVSSGIAPHFSRSGAEFARIQKCSGSVAMPGSQGDPARVARVRGEAARGSAASASELNQFGLSNS